MRLHHLAILGPDPASLAAFYAGVLALPELRRAHDDVGVRAVWLDAEGIILMFERGSRGQNGVIVFAAARGSAATWRARLGEAYDGRTDYTLYGRDPDGNRFGLSSHPEPMGPEQSRPPAC